MDALQAALNWFAGNGQYMTLYHCMGGDVFWIVLTIVLDLVVAAGYVVIAVHWNRNQASLHNVEARRALGRMRNIFILCGLCGYLFIPIKMFWPAWRLYDIVLVVLAYFTWRYAWNAWDLKVVYRELGRAERLSHELERSQAESQRKTAFLNAVSHDLKNPLYALSLHAELAQANLDDGDIEDVRRSLQQIRNCTTDATGLLTGFMELGRLDWSQDPVNASLFDVRDLVQGVVQRLAPLAQQKQLELEAHTNGQVMLQTDRAKLDRVLGNLVSNAIKYTERGRVALRLRHEGDAVVIEVQDTGPGITPEHQEQLFDEFYQVHNHERNREKGFGLGLAIARRLVEQLGGAIELDSEPGRGSRFSVLIPQAQPDSRPRAA